MRNKIRIPFPIVGFSLLLVFSVASYIILAPESFAQNSGEEVAVRAMFQKFEKYFNEGNSKAIGKLYTENADRRNSSGKHARGRAEVEEMYETLILNRPMRSISPNWQISFEFEVRFLRPDVAILDGFYTLPDNRRGIFTVLATKENGKWMMAAGRDGGIIN